MSVLFTTITKSFIAMCADRQATNMITEEVEINAITKIEKWTPEIMVGQCGSAALSNIILSTTHSYLSEQGIEKFTLEEAADTICQAYYAAKEEYKDMPENLTSKIVVAGKLSNGSLGAVTTLMTNGNAEIDVYEANENPMTLIYEPDDMTSEECNELFSKAISNSKNKKKTHSNLLETAHRKAVRYVSEQSKYVGYKSDFIMITIDDLKANRK